MSLLILSMVHLIRAGEGAPALVGPRWGESPGSHALVYLCWGRNPGSRVSVPGNEPRFSRSSLRSGEGLKCDDHAVSCALAHLRRGSGPCARRRGGDDLVPTWSDPSPPDMPKFGSGGIRLRLGRCIQNGYLYNWIECELPMRENGMWFTSG